MQKVEALLFGLTSTVNPLPPPGTLLPRQPPIQDAIASIKQRLVNQSPTGTGDVYDDTSSYLPVGLDRLFHSYMYYTGS